MTILEETLNRLIAKELGVRPEEVTAELIQARRVEIYARPTFKYVGVPPWLRVYNQYELEVLAQRAERFLKQFS